MFAKEGKLQKAILRNQNPKIKGITLKKIYFNYLTKSINQLSIPFYRHPRTIPLLSIHIIQIHIKMSVTSTSSKKPSFLLKTYQILQKGLYSQSICWHPTSQGFLILNPEKFSSQVLPHYFKHSNMASFIRQLNMYGFCKLRGVEQSSRYYYHPYFSREDKSLLSKIQRKVQKRSCKDIGAQLGDRGDRGFKSEISIQIDREDRGDREEGEEGEGVNEKGKVGNQNMQSQNVMNSFCNIYSCVEQNGSKIDKQINCELLSDLLQKNKTILSLQMNMISDLLSQLQHCQGSLAPPLLEQSLLKYVWGQQSHLQKLERSLEVGREGKVGGN